MRDPVDVVVQTFPLLEPTQSPEVFRGSDVYVRLLGPWKRLERVERPQTPCGAAAINCGHVGQMLTEEVDRRYLSNSLLRWIHVLCARVNSCPTDEPAAPALVGRLCLRRCLHLELIVNARRPSDLFGELNGARLSGSRGDRAFQRDDAIARVDADVAAFQRVLSDQKPLQLGGDPGIGNRFTGLGQARPGALDERAIDVAVHLQLVVYLRHARDFRETGRLSFLSLGSDSTAERYGAIVHVDTDVVFPDTGVGLETM